MKNTGGRNGVVKKNKIKATRIIKADIPVASNISLAPLLFRKELTKVKVIMEKLKATRRKYR